VRLGIKAKLTGTAFVTTTLLLVTLAVAGYRYFVGEFKDAITRQQFTMIAMVAQQLDAQLAHSEAMLAGIAHGFDPARLGDVDRSQRILDSERDAREYFDGGFLLLDAAGRILTESPAYPDRRGKDWTHRDFVREAIRTGKPFISAPYRSSVAPFSPTVTISVPIPGADGKLAGVLAGRHDLLRDNYLAGLSRTSVGTSGYLYIVDSNRTLLMHPDKRRILEVISPGMNPGLDRALAGFEGAVENVNSKGVAGLTAFKALKTAKWFIASHYPLKEAYAPLNRARILFSIGLPFMILLSLGAALLLSRTIADPIVQLTGVVKAASAGKGPGPPISLKTGDEIESLAEAFNGLIRENDLQQQTLMENQELYMILAEFPHELVLLRNPDGSIRYISSNCRTLTGYADTEYYADPELLDRIIHPDDLDRWLHHLDTPGEDGSYSLDLRIEGRDGTVRWFNHVCRNIDTYPGQSGGNRGSFREITRRVALERELQSQRRFLESLLESTSTPMFVIGADHKVLFWNRALEALSGTSASSVVGTDGQWRPFYPEKRPCLADLVADGKIGCIPELYSTYTTELGLPGIVRAEGWYPDLGGQTRYIFFDAAPVLAPDGRLVAVVETLHDITGRKLAERAIQEHQAELEEKHREQSRLFQLVAEGKREWEHTMDCIDDIVLLADGDGRIRRCNKALTGFLGISYQEVLGADWQRLLASAAIDLSATREQSGEICHTPTGRWFSFRLYPDEEGGGQIVSLHDFTERKQVSDQLAGAYSELKATHMQLLQQEKMASIGQLAAGVAHEINNPMGFISSNLGALGKYAARLSEFIAAQGAAAADADREASGVRIGDLRRKLKIDYVLEDIPKLIAESRDGAERVRVIVQNLKSFSRIDEAKVEATDLNACIESTITIVWNELKYKAALVREFGELPPVTCHAQQLNQVFMNLLVNAAHAIEKQGTITVRTRAEGGSACVSITDTGCGIPEEIRSRIFEPFFTTKDVGKGTGLGLSISYDIVKRHGGSLEVDSEVGRGTTFTVRLPIEGQPA
jgi:two-component system NtrC family sensor kinase